MALDATENNLNENSEIDITNHLLEVEKNASQLINNALKTADEKKSAAMAQFNSDFKIKYEKMVVEQKSEYEAKIQQLKTEHENEFSDFKKSVESKRVDKASFNLLLEKLLFETL